MKDILHRLKKMVQNHPNNPAIAIDGLTLYTYAEFWAKVQHLSLQLKEMGSVPGSLIALHLEKSADYVVALFAVWMAEAAFMPLSPSLPQARKREILSQSEPNLIIHSSDQIEKKHGNSLYPNHLAYIIFTSGSTGKPKGVMVSHHGLLNVLEQQIHYFKLNASHRSLFYLSMQFDASISDIGTTLLSGALLDIPTASPTELLKNLPQILKNQHITHLDIPPSVLALLALEDIPSSVQTLIIGGEVCPLPVVQKWAQRLYLVNVYGPTEATICTSMKVCVIDEQEANIGQPIENMAYKLLDANQNTSNPGELYISGVGLALGFTQNTLLTQEKFVSIDGILFYRTGDLVKRNKNGDYIYQGRIDRQLKHNGQLIAPEEIEAVLHQHPCIHGAAVFMHEASQKMVAVYEAKDLTAGCVRYFLRQRLPSWMIPQQLLRVDTLPKIINEKIDFKSLQQSALKQDGRLAETRLHYHLQKIWQEVLHLPELPSIDAHLLDDLGADSLDVLKLMVRLEKEAILLSLELLNHLPTIEDLAHWIRHQHFEAVDAMSTQQLREEVEALWPSLNFNDSVTAPKAPYTNSKTSTVLLTGATGFVGIHLLEELLSKTQHTIMCVIRATNPQEAQEKLWKRAHSYEIALEAYHSRIEILCGDLALPLLGQNAETWARLCKSIQSIYHCAAEVNLLKSFEALRKVNLEATAIITQLATLETPKPIFYISTLSVLAATDKDSEIAQEGPLNRETSWVYGGYTQSKWAAEYFLQHSKVKTTIFRLGLITGHAHKNRMPLTDWLTPFLRSLWTLGTLPEGNWAHLFLDATPVDYAAAAIVNLAQSPEATHYHLANTSGFSLQMIVDALKRRGKEIKSLPYDQWQALAMSDASRLPAFFALGRLKKTNEFGRHLAMDLFKSTDLQFELSNAYYGLRNTSIRCPKADEDLLDLYINRILYE